ncbi:MAG: LapA family protein [Syntrophobacterales bacterium]|nr:LapA family protein [Syntrophobacterales bacterium]
MKTFKIIMWVILLSFFGIALYQNRQTLSIDLPFSLNLYFRPEVRWSYPVGNIMGFSAFAGFIIGSWMFFRLYWKKRRELKQCMNSLKELSLSNAVDSSGIGKMEESGQPSSLSNDRVSRGNTQ